MAGKRVKWSMPPWEAWLLRRRQRVERKSRERFEACSARVQARVPPPPLMELRRLGALLRGLGALAVILFVLASLPLMVLFSIMWLAAYGLPPDPVTTALRVALFYLVIVPFAYLLVWFVAMPVTFSRELRANCYLMQRAWRNLRGVMRELRADYYRLRWGPKWWRRR